MSTAALLLLLLRLAAPPGDDVVEARQLGGLDARAAALMLSGQNGGDLPFEGLVVPLGEAEEGVRLALVLDIGGVEPGGGEEPRLYEVYAYVLEAGDRVSAFLSQGFLLGPEQAGRRVKFFGELRLALGEYSLRLFVRRRGDERFALRTLPLRVAPFGSESAAPPLAALPEEEWVVALAGSELPFVVDGQPAAPFVPSPEAETAETAEAVGRTTEEAPSAGLRLLPGYVAALRRLAGGAQGARDEVVAVERAALGEANNRQQEIVRAKLLKLAERLAALDPESLVPWIALYDELYREHHGSSDYLMSTHDREMLAALGQLYVHRAGPEKAGPLVACALVSLGGYLLDIGSVPTAQAPIEAALKHDPNQVGALGLLAELYETRGEYEEAVHLLHRLVDLDPGDETARLRLAVNLGRLGDAAAAEGLLTECLTAGKVWVAVLAHQELARLLLSQGRTAEAVALLEEALKRWPQSQRLHLQLAAALDQAGRPTAAAEALATLDPAQGREEPTPRLLYTGWPAEPAEEARRTLAAAGEKRRTALAVALDKLGERGR